MSLLTIEAAISLLLLVIFVGYLIVGYRKLKEDLMSDISDWQDSLVNKLTFLDATKLLESRIEEQQFVRSVRSLTILSPVIGVILTALFTILFIGQIDGSVSEIKFDMDSIGLLLGVGLGALGAVLNQWFIVFVLEKELLVVRDRAAERFQGELREKLIIEPSSHIVDVRQSVIQASEALKTATEGLFEQFNLMSKDYMNMIDHSKTSIQELCEVSNNVATSLEEANFKSGIAGLNDQMATLTSAIGEGAEKISSQVTKSYEHFGSLVTEVNTSVENAKQTIVTSSETHMTGFKTVIESLHSGFEHLITEMNQNVSTQFADANESFKTQVEGMNEQLHEGLASISTSFNGSIENLVDKIQEDLQAIFNIINSKFSSDDEMLAKFKTGFSHMIQSMESSVKNANSEIKRAGDDVEGILGIRGYAETLSKELTQFNSGFSSQLGDFRSAIENVITSLEDLNQRIKKRRRF